MRDNILTGLKELKLPRYKDLPDFGIYSEQLVEIVNKALEAMFDKDNKLTKSMVNNYVKHKIMPSPIKKRYFRNHIVYCIVITVFKNNLSIAEIDGGILHELKKSSIEESYNYFCDKIESVMRLIIDILDKQDDPDTKMTATIDVDLDKRNGLTLAIVSVCTKVITQKLLEYELLNAKEDI
ncbi:MAG: DUF1836 domain-containing protein [Eubacteriales bacterium]|jgi:hypothetical protein|uniref:DUF1836 domain-containing protein n=1 Tax=Fenollaria TaxID=1686313 RepID=UPI00071CD23C|nr:MULTISPECIES: DUF1836 domain-containing protein [Fenollaria]MDD7339659.1 DUF1836 domain-containing protein [Eubacteriales bacterium]MDY3106445.1 DUF1836 domain-containing protein [Fenollaria sp.]